MLHSECRRLHQHITSVIMAIAGLVTTATAETITVCTSGGAKTLVASDE